MYFSKKLTSSNSSKINPPPKPLEQRESKPISHFFGDNFQQILHFFGDKSHQKPHFYGDKVIPSLHFCGDK
jgi:hypothetical protein